MRRWWKNEGGASALEFALVMPAFCTMVFGTAQMGMAFYNAGTVQYALERTARMVMVDQDMTAGQVQAAFAAQIRHMINENVPVTYSIDSSGTVPVAQLSAAYVHHFIIPFIPTFNITFDVESRVPLDPTGT